MARYVFQTASIAAGAEVSLMQSDVNAQAIRSSVFDRVINRIGIAGATVNTGVLTALIGTDEILKVSNGVTNTAGAPMKQEDSYAVAEFVGAGENLDLRVKNTSAGALQYYVYVETTEIVE